MQRLMVVAAIFVSGCTVGSQPDAPGTAEEEKMQRQARIAFEAWNESNARADAEASYHGLSTQMRSEWMWTRLRDASDRVTREHVGRLEPTTREVLMAWYNAHEKYRPAQAEALPTSILTSRWLQDLYREHFMRSKDVTVAQAKIRQVKSVYADNTGVTVMTSVDGVSELYGLVYEGDGWKIQVYMPATRRRS